MIMRKDGLNMETGIKAWLANLEPIDGPIRVDLPCGWHWDMQPNDTGYLKGPDGGLCVGYDLDKQSIRFGSEWEGEIHGLNLWTIQEMGEKFAKENFMDEQAIEAYEAFAAERNDARKIYERSVRSELAETIQLELKEGKWTAHVDAPRVLQITGITTKPELSGEEGVALFNQMSAARQVMPLRDPLGYMTLNDNLYDYIKDQYTFQYEDMIDNIDAGFINGNGRGCEAVLDKLDATVRKNIREYCLPDGVHYQSLRHVEVTDDLRSAVDEFVKNRVTKTVDFERKRSHSKESLERDHQKFLAAGAALKTAIGEAVLPPLDVSLGQEDNMNYEQ